MSSVKPPNFIPLAELREILLARRGSLCFLALVSTPLSPVFFLAPTFLRNVMLLFLVPFVLLLDSGPSLLPTWRNTHVKINTVCLFFNFFFIRESERDGYSGSGQELRWSESSDFWPHFFPHPTIRQVIKRRSEWHQSMTNRLPSTRAHCLPPNSYLRADLIHHLLP